MRIFCAPLQGYTTAPFRKFHAEIFGGVDAYGVPFLHLEKGMPRKNDVEDLKSDLNRGVEIIPQILFRDYNEFITLVDAVTVAGFSRIDMNCGCPFPPQTGRGRGAGFISNRTEMEKIAGYVESHPELTFSLKMRLGKEMPDEWRGIADIINSMPLEYVAVHPRTARQQYRGELYTDVFGDMLSEIGHPIVFNGELRTPEDIDAVTSGYQALYGVMTGRGLLGRPSLGAEWLSGREWPKSIRLEKMIMLHSRLFGYYADRLCGEAQLLIKMKTFWEFAEPEIGRKAAKAIRKATSIAAYNSAVESIC